MNAKERAEQWLSKTDNHLNEDKTKFLSETEYAKKAYIAGAKENGVVWHKVTDGDLPKESRTVLDEAGDRFYYFRGHFYYESDSRFDCQPIAWCEIPTYEEE